MSNELGPIRGVPCLHTYAAEIGSNTFPVSQRGIYCRYEVKGKKNRYVRKIASIQRGAGAIIVIIK